MTGALETNVLIAHVTPQVHFHPGRAFPFAGLRGELTPAVAGMGAVSRGREEGARTSPCGRAQALSSERNLTKRDGRTGGMRSAGWAQRTTLKEEAMLTLFLNTRNWLNTGGGKGLAGYRWLLGLIATVLLVALALLGGFFLAYLVTAGTAGVAWSGGGAG
jgi:hypothetical protein